MKLYKEKDYRILSIDDEEKYIQIRDSELTGKRFGRVNKFREYPKAARHFEHLFPNNYLDIVELKDSEAIKTMCTEYQKKLDTNPNEQEMLNFINENEYYILIASIFKFYNFGHHEAYLFKEFPLAGAHRVDYLLVGKGSGGYEFIFIELEHPSDNAFLSTTADYAQSYRKGINQVNDWRRTLEVHFNNMSIEFNKAIKTNQSLPNEFYLNDSSRRHYIVIAGRRAHYRCSSEKAYEIRRNEERTSGIKILHYDNLIDYTLELIGKDSF
ncbi:Shedu anti-phage system protein SduA domain-containing protein [Psychrobacillus soli]|uniref:DUF4263 domain-containing protein n=1 Tax=Psychrobacillus soli TaxID=1543965 RepID=A0A544TBE9_9BACI|nr:Shedu anti-phage system protein SduA domain-containing protein [Psychrobacillus soli]TQR14729.1 DUF4263 domain-containing protein [Psychrobacillus soli]